MALVYITLTSCFLLLSGAHTQRTTLRDLTLHFPSLATTLKDLFPISQFHSSDVNSASVSSLPDITQLNSTLMGDSNKCFFKLLTLYQGLSSKDPLKALEAITFLDAAGKPGSGITQGNFLMMGSYDLCLTMANSTKGYYQPCKVLGNVYFGKTPLPFDWMGCLPEECRKGNFTELENMIIKYASNYTKAIGITLKPGSFKLSCKPEFAWDTGATVANVLLYTIVALVCIGTGWHLIEPLVWSAVYPPSHDKKMLVVEEEGHEDTTVQAAPDHRPQAVPDSTFNTLVKCFSLQRTFGALFSTDTKPGQVLCLNGIRVLSINWVVLGHFYLIPIASTGDMNYIYTDLFHRFSFTAVLNGLPSVDSFFTLSGFLVSYLLLKQLKKRRGSLSPLQWMSYYIHRYLRLTVPYLLVMLIQAFLYPHWAPGGPFPESLISDHKFCKDYMWTNLLYVNNFVPANASEMCLGQSWYLANDFQFYIVAPFFILLLFYRPKAGIGCTVGGIVSAAVTAGIITWHYKLGPASVADPNQNNMHLLYNKPYVRISPYLIGICGGWVLWKYSDILQIRVNQMRLWKKVVLSLVIWTITVTVQYWVVFGLHDDIVDVFVGKKSTMAESVSYESLAKIAWGLTLVVQILACQFGLGGVINSFLSWKGWIILSRLTYGVYLLHFGLIELMVNQLRHPFYYRPDYEIMFYYFGGLGMSYLAGTLLFTCVEQPLAYLEALTYRKQ